MKILYFTTTGNSLAVARAIGGELLSVVGLLEAGVGELRDDDAVGVVCPVYFGELPLPVSELLSRVVIDAPYRFLVLTCGSTPAMAVRASGGWDYVRSILMVDNYFPMFDVGKQIDGMGRKRVGEHLAEIVRIFQCGSVLLNLRRCSAGLPDGGCGVSLCALTRIGGFMSRIPVRGVAFARVCVRWGISCC